MPCRSVLCRAVLCCAGNSACDCCCFSLVEQNLFAKYGHEGEVLCSHLTALLTPHCNAHTSLHCSHLPDCECTASTASLQRLPMHCLAASAHSLPTLPHCTPTSSTASLRVHCSGGAGEAQSARAQIQTELHNTAKRWFRGRSELCDTDRLWYCTALLLHCYCTAQVGLS